MVVSAANAWDREAELAWRPPCGGQAFGTQDAALKGRRYRNVSNLALVMPAAMSTRTVPRCPVIMRRFEN